MSPISQLITACFIILLMAPTDSKAAFRCHDVFNLQHIVGLPEGHILAIKPKVYNYYVNKTLAAEAEFKHSQTSQVLTIELIEVKPEFQRRGISRNILKALLRTYPETKEIESVLVADNAQAFVLARDAGLTPRQAVRETPAYRIREELGFTKILEVQQSTLFGRTHVEWSVSRESSN